MDEEEELRLKAQARLRIKQQKEKAAAKSEPKIKWQTKENTSILPDFIYVAGTVTSIELVGYVAIEEFDAHT